MVFLYGRTSQRMQSIFSHLSICQFPLIWENSQFFHVCIKCLYSTSFLFKKKYLWLLCHFCLKKGERVSTQSCHGLIANRIASGVLINWYGLTWWEFHNVYALLLIKKVENSSLASDSFMKYTYNMVFCHSLIIKLKHLQ